MSLLSVTQGTQPTSTFCAVRDTQTVKGGGGGGAEEKRNASTDVTLFCDMKYWVFFVYFESMQLLALYIYIFFNLLSGVCE